MKQRRTEIAFEIARAFVFGSHWRDRAAWCRECECYVPLIETFTAATLAGATCAEIFRRAEIGELHFEVTARGQLLICLCSLLDSGDELNVSNVPSNYSENNARPASPEQNF
jgi:hypothetical protein